MVTMTAERPTEVRREGVHGWALTYMFLEDVYEITGVPMPESIVWLVGEVKGVVSSLNEFDGLMQQLGMAHDIAMSILRECGYEAEFQHGYVIRKATTQEDG